MRSRYDLAQNSVTEDESGVLYKDIFTIPIQKFQYTDTFLEYRITSKDIERPDLLVNRAYKKSELDDLVMWINDVGLIYNAAPGDKIKIPTLKNLEDFYYDKRV